MNIILSIHPKWAKLIYEGKKTVEWRKIVPSCLLPIHLSQEKLTVYLYETTPVKKVTGYFICNGVARVDFSEPPFEGAEICDEAKKIIKEGCVPLEDLKKYKGEKSVLYGMKVFYPHKFTFKPIDIKQFNIKRPPQSWCYTEVCVK